MKLNTKTLQQKSNRVSGISILIMTSYLVLMLTLGIVAAVPSRVEQAAKEQLRTEIVRQISCPDFIKENSEANYVEAVISVDTMGHIVLHSINSKNPEAQNYVSQTLRGIKMPGHAPTDKVTLLVKFRVA